MKKKYLLLPLVALLFSCGGSTNNGGSYKPAREYGDDKDYALFMLNYPRITSTSASGLEERVENLLYLRQEITVNELIEKPNPDPVREGYEFQGWFKEQTCDNLWDFNNDKPESSVFLYAKWGNSQEEEFEEPEYVYPERIITDMNYKVTGILNKSVEDGQVNLTSGGINRLKKHKEDVSFAVNYERKADVNLTVATFDEATSMIHLEVSSGEEFDIKVNDITATLNIANENTGFETKAKNYEAKGEDIENYHIALAGSSSMENWSTSTEDMAPIVTYNHGIGGTTVEQWTNKLFERLVLPYSPKAVVYYVGVNNIINSGKKGSETATALEALFEKTHQMLPETKIFYVLINKLPGYPHLQEEFDVANNFAIDYAKANDYLTCIDAGVGLLKSNGEPHYGYFCTDGLHMSKFGYVIWGAAVKKAVIDWLMQ